MQAIARLKPVDEWPTRLRSVLPPSQVFLTEGQTYEIHGVAVVDDLVMLQVVDSDEGWPNWYPAWFFETVDPSIPPDWICRSFSTVPQLLLGPAFLASDQEAYSRMVQLERPEVDLFSARIERLEAERRGAAETVELLQWAEREDLPDGRPRPETPPERPGET